MSQPNKKAGDPHWNTKPRPNEGGSSEAGSEPRSSSPGMNDSSSGPSDGMMRTEERLKEAEGAAKSLRLPTSILEKSSVPQQKERECTIPPPRPMRCGHELDMRAARRSRHRRSRHRQISRSVHTERYNTPRDDRVAYSNERFPEAHAARTFWLRPPHARGTVQLDQVRDGVRPIRALLFFESPSPEFLLSLRRRQLAPCNDECKESFCPGHVAATSDGESRSNDANNQAETQSASVPSDADLDIRISYEDSSEETQTGHDPRGTSLEPPTECVLANEDDYLANDDREGPRATPSEPLSEYVLANEDDYLAENHSDCEDDV